MRHRGNGVYRSGGNADLVLDSEITYPALVIARCATARAIVIPSAIAPLVFSAVIADE